LLARVHAVGEILQGAAAAVGDAVDHAVMTLPVPLAPRLTSLLSHCCSCRVNIAQSRF
jgi:hypothetical protein